MVQCNAPLICIAFLQQKFELAELLLAFSGYIPEDTVIPTPKPSLPAKLKVPDLHHLANLTLLSEKVWINAIVDGQQTEKLIIPLQKVSEKVAVVKEKV